MKPPPLRIGDEREMTGTAGRRLGPRAPATTHMGCSGARLLALCHAVWARTQATTSTTRAQMLTAGGVTVISGLARGTAVDDMLGASGGQLDGKVIADITNSVDSGRRGPALLLGTGDKPGPAVPDPTSGGVPRCGVSERLGRPSRNARKGRLGAARREGRSCATALSQ
jgi:hypothetical protein